MTTTGHRYHSDFARRYFDQGEAAGRAGGEAAALLAFLDARGVEIPDSVRDEIAGCTDLDRLGLWIRRAATVGKVVKGAVYTGPGNGIYEAVRHGQGPH